MALFGFLGGKKTSVGLDIGSGIIKLVVIDHGGSEAELTKVATTEVAADAIVEGEVMDPGLVSEAIRGLFEAAGVKRKSVVTAVGGRDVIVKKIQMDRMKEADAREVIRWEAEQHVPFDMANVELDFQILDPDAEGLQMNVLLVAAKRELVESRVGLLGEAGLDPGIIDVDAFAIHNAFELNHPDAMQGVVGLVNIGHEVTNVNILEDGIPVLTRDLSVGTRRFREDLQREKGVAADEAEKIIQGVSQHADLAGYVSGFKDSPDTMFITHQVFRGFTGLLEEYKRDYPTRAAMGTLSFSDLEVHPLDENFAVVTGKYRLERGKKDGGNAEGLFSLVFENTDNGWKIVVDHTT